MKKIWNLMLVALVILGAAACTENVDSVDLKSEGVSFYATIGDEDTRAYIEDENGDKKWNTVWEDGDILDVTVDGETLYTFTYNSTTGKFISNDEGATSLIGENVKILSQTGGNRDSKAGKKAWAINTTTVENFANNATVKLEASTSFFRYTYEGDGDVTFEVVVTDENIDPKPCVFQYDGDSYESVTISGVKGENFVGFWTQNINPIEAKLSYSIGGVKCKETTLNLAPGKVYNLGTLEDPKISDYSVVGTNNGWTAGETPMYVQGDYVVALGVVFEESSDPEGARFKILGTNDNWIGTKNNAEIGKWRITGGSDIKIAAGEYDIYYAPNSAKYCIVAVGEELPAMPEFSISIIGQNMTGCENWNTDLTMALDGDYYTRKGVTFAAGNEFKLRISKDWDESYGMSGEATVTITKDTKLTLVKGGQNMKVEAGTYDLYFSDKTKDFFVMTPGTTPADLEKPIVWVLTGSFNGWNETACIMVETVTDNLFVAEDIELKSGDEIKVKDSTTWDTSYGGGITNLNANSWMKAYFNGSNIVVAKSGTYDVYFEYIKDGEFSKMYLMEADADHSTATEQTENGALIPDDDIPTDLVLGIVTSELGWNASAALEMVASDGWYVYSNLELYKDDAFKIVKDKKWDVSYGGDGGVLAADVDTIYTLSSNNSGNIKPTKNGKFNIYFNPVSFAFKYECVEEYTNLTVNITIINEANWSPLYIYLEDENKNVLTNKDGDPVENNKYSISGDYIGSTLTYKFISGSQVSTPDSVTITKNGATVTVTKPAEVQKLLYLKPNANWKVDSARFAAYFFGGEVGEKWVSMTDSDSDGICEAVIPAGYDYGCNVIFCRMNPNAAANNWDNKWNQTADLTAPTDGKNLYTVKEGTWDKGGGSWSVK